MKNINKIEEKWEKEKDILERTHKINEEKSKYKKKIPTSKLLIAFLFLDCTLIQLFTGYVTIRSFELGQLLQYQPDFTPLITLIGSVVGEVIGLAVYSVKSMKENTRGGITYETTMRKIDNQYEENNENEEDMR